MTKEAVDERVKARIAAGQTPKEIADYVKTHSSSGRKGVLEKNLKEALARWEKDHWNIDAWKIANLYTELGDKDKAFAWIDKAIELRSGVLIWLYVGDHPFCKKQANAYSFGPEVRLWEVISALGIDPGRITDNSDIARLGKGCRPCENWL